MSRCCVLFWCLAIGLLLAGTVCRGQDVIAAPVACPGGVCGAAGADSRLVDQDACQREAEFMAAFDIRDHVGKTIGDFEGVGWSTSGGVVDTCVPPEDMSLTGDAVASSNGVDYRVRAWRRVPVRDSARAVSVPRVFGGKNAAAVRRGRFVGVFRRFFSSRRARR